MSFFPSAIATLRALVNRPGAEYNEANTKTFYAEDHNSLIDEVVAIETELGTNPKGSHDSVADRLGDAEASIATKQASLGYTPEDVTNKDTSVALGTSDSKYPSQKAVKSYIDNRLDATIQQNSSYSANNVYQNTNNWSILRVNSMSNGATSSYMAVVYSSSSSSPSTVNGYLGHYYEASGCFIIPPNHYFKVAPQPNCTITSITLNKMTFA